MSIRCVVEVDVHEKSAEDLPLPWGVKFTVASGDPTGLVKVTEPSGLLVPPVDCTTAVMVVATFTAA